MVRIGVIGAGDIGFSHIRRITEDLHGGRITAVTDIDEGHAAQAAAFCGARVFPDGESLIASPEVDAVIVASWDATHEGYVLACIAAGKPVLCEKPLSVSEESCRRIVDAEMAAGRRLVKVGFMRRYDEGYRAVRDAMYGAIGQPLIVHCAHRNKCGYAQHCTENSVKNSTVHEIDLMRWMLGEDMRTAQVFAGRASSRGGEGLKDPLTVLLESESGVRIDVEVFINSGIGYEVHCTAVGEDGVADMPEPARLAVRAANQKAEYISDDWKVRFYHAYNRLFQQFIDEVQAGCLTAPSAWDGFMATYTAECCVKALYSGGIEPIAPLTRPDFYGKE